MQVRLEIVHRKLPVIFIIIPISWIGFLSSKTFPSPWNSTICRMSFRFIIIDIIHWDSNILVAQKTLVKANKMFYKSYRIKNENNGSRKMASTISVRWKWQKQLKPGIWQFYLWTKDTFESLCIRKAAASCTTTASDTTSSISSTIKE